VTSKGQICDPIIFEAPYLRNGARWTHGNYGPPIGTRPPGVKWSKGQTRDPIISNMSNMQCSKTLEITEIIAIPRKSSVLTDLTRLSCSLQIGTV